MEATVLSIGKSVVNGALSYAKSAVAKEVALQLGVHSDQAFITDELEMMQAFLAAAHDERDDHKVVKTWVKQVRDVAYDVEDSLQDFAVRIENYSWWRIRAVLDRRRIAKEMKDLRVKVEDVSQRNVRYRLVRGSASKPTSNDEQSIISTEVQLQIAEATRAALQDKNKVDLVKLITQDEDVPSAIAVWGASSDVGVASIIRAAYDNQDVKAKFECRAWMRLARPFNPNDFFASLVRQFYGEPCKDSVKKTGVEVFKQMEAQDNLVDEFNRFVTEKRYLVVINDVSTIEEWDWIKTYFPNNKGSQIIVSTQQFEVASLCTEQPYMVSEIEQKWSFDKEFFAFYKKVDAGTQEESKSGSSSTEPEKLTPSIAMAAALVEDELIDRVEAKAKLLELLYQGGEVIAIYGMGGLGKTTLVRSVYQEHGDRFHRRAWLTVSRSFTEKEFIGELLQQLLRNNEDKGGSGSDKEANATLQKKKEKEPIAQLAEILLEHNCLIVFDDLWSVEKWKWIMKLLPPPRNEGRNRIIVTTRELNIAEHCSSGKENIYNLDLLNEEDARELFKKKVFKGNKEKDDCSHNLDMIEEENHILKKCGGLPLAISSIGSFLASKPKTATEWRNLNKHISAELEINPELGMIKTVLTSSYEGLQYHLKPCFLYLSIFSEDQDIRWKRLVRRWIAEGYSRGRRSMTAEEIGAGYITELIDRTMVQPSKGATRRIGRSVFLQVHDLIREIGISKAAEENLVTRLEGSCNINTEGKIRHLAVSSSWRRDQDAFESGLDLSHLRSLTVFGAWQSFFISDKMRFLRVLDLEDTVGITDHDLHQICQLFLLSYLSLRRCDGILRLPNSLGNLKFLETLDIRDTGIINLPRTIVKLRKMQYLRVGFVPKHEEERKTNCISAIMAHGSFCVSSCYNFFRYFIRVLVVRPCYRICDHEFCLDFSMQLVRLLLGCIYFVVWCVVWLLLFMGFGPLLLLACCSWVVMKDGLDGLPLFFFGLNPRGGVKVPRGIRQLKALHTLGVVNIDGANAILEDLCYLTELRKLRVTGLNKSNCVRFFRAITGNDCLESLLVWSHGDPGIAGCFDEVSPAPKNLQRLKLYGNLVQWPEWIKGLENLGKLELRSTMISEHDKAIKCLGELPKLINLHLLKESFSNERVSFSFHHGAFPSLRVLEMSLWYVTPTIWSSASILVRCYGCFQNNKITTASTNQGNLERVKFEDGAAPKLEVLLFSGNPSETDVGLFSGLKYLTSLKELMLHNNDYKDAFLEDLGKQLAENTISVPILKRYDYDYHRTVRNLYVA